MPSHVMVNDPGKAPDGALGTATPGSLVKPAAASDAVGHKHRKHDMSATPQTSIETELQLARERIEVLLMEAQADKARIQQLEAWIKSQRDMNLNELAQRIYIANHKWWHDRNGTRLDRNKGELLCLIHSEVSEAMEGERKSLMDDKLPHRRMAEVELADALIRILDYAAGFGYDIQGAVEEKLAFNATRDDHTHEARARANGKKW